MRSMKEPGTNLRQALEECGFIPAPRPDMHPEQIKACIRMAGTTPAILADELGITKTAISQVIHGIGRSHRVEQRISDVTGIPTSQLWPNRKASLVRKGRKK